MAMRELPFERHCSERQWRHISRRRASRLVGVDPKTTDVNALRITLRYAR